MHLLFVCTGNTCRSPLAEGIARHVIGERGLIDITVASAGIATWEGASASDGSLLVAMEHGIDLSAHRSTPLTADLVAAADLILTMSESHLARVAELGGATNAFLLTDFASKGENADGVHDPFGGDLEAYRDTYRQLDALVRDTLDRVVDSQLPPG